MSDASKAPTPLCGRARLLQQHPWAAFVLPLAVYMLIGSLEPARDAATGEEQPGGAAIGLAIPYAHYPLVYTLKLALTAVVLAVVWPGYRQFPARITLLAVVVGVVGAVVWIGLCGLGIEENYLRPALKPVHLDWLIAAGTRSAFSPLEELADHPARAWGFLAIRFAGLVVVVPLVEEFFYRGFLMRFVVRHDWWNVPPGEANATAVVLATLVPMVMHPAELLAAAVWFSMITWLYVRGRSVWDCIAAHAVTNLLLGIYVVQTGHWQLM